MLLKGKKSVVERRKSTPLLVDAMSFERLEMAVLIALRFLRDKKKNVRRFP